MKQSQTLLESIVQALNGLESKDSAQTALYQPAVLLKPAFDLFAWDEDEDEEEDDDDFEDEDEDDFEWPEDEDDELEDEDEDEDDEF